MGNGLDLLRLLEPAVRPDGSAGPCRAQRPAGPIETRDFESLLAEAAEGGGGAEAPNETGEASDAPEGAGEAAAGPRGGGPLGALGQVDRVENAALRGLLGGARAEGSGG